jgi:hypothetical protein
LRNHWVSAPASGRNGDAVDGDDVAKVDAGELVVLHEPWHRPILELQLT